jgi:ribosome-associated translation inhibitor RaiA
MPMPVALDVFSELIREAPAEMRKIIVENDEDEYVEALYASIDQILDRIEAQLDNEEQKRERTGR